jgi:hypothetical protein
MVAHLWRNAAEAKAQGEPVAMVFAKNSASSPERTSWQSRMVRRAGRGGVVELPFDVLAIRLAS